MKLLIEPVKVPRGYIHPPPKNDILPRHEFSLGLIGKFIEFDYLFDCCFVQCMLPIVDWLNGCHLSLD